MSLALTVREEWDDGKRFHVIGTLVASGNYVAGGEVPSTGARTGIRSKGTTKAPLDVQIQGKSGFVYSYDRATEKVQVWCNTAGAANAALGEHTAVAYVAGVTGDVIDVHAVFPKFG